MCGKDFMCKAVFEGFVLSTRNLSRLPNGEKLKYNLFGKNIKKIKLNEKWN